jgi:hypothetical protein
MNIEIERETLEQALTLLAVATFHAPALQAERTALVDAWLKVLAQPVQPAQRQPLTAWQAIETALPEPGKPVLVACGKQVVRAVHAPKFTLSEDDWGDFLPDGGVYDAATDASYWPEGWYEWNSHEETHWQLDNKPTHWMPLPDAPAAHGIGEKP